MIKLTVLGKPLAKGRPKFSSKGKFVRVYTPKKTTDYETLIKFSAQEVAPKELLEGPVTMEIEAHLPIPKAMSKKKRALIKSHDLRPITRPDIDNYAKIVLDALNDIIYKDDNQVVSLNIRKFYSEKPRMEIYIKEL